MHRIIAIALLVIGAVRIASTYEVFSETSDEPNHLTAGLQLLTDHEYSFERQNPPLPRLFMALGPFLHGARFDRTAGIAQIASVFYSTGDYDSMRVLARAGTLIFFLIAALATWRWARRELGDAGALVTLAVFTTQPSVLGHAGLATLDSANVAGVAVSLLACSRWLERPNAARAALLGAAYGFSVLCKMLCLAYVPAACAGVLAVRLLRGERPRITTIAIVPPVAALVVAAGYAFRLDIFWSGLLQLLSVNREGFLSYALGRTTTDGWWWYFPLTLALKTTLATLILLAIGFVVARRDRAFQSGVAAVAAMLILVLPTNVNIGIRYILPLYVPLSLAVGATIMAAMRHRLLRYAGVLLVAWHLAASTLAHPDYLAYFNELAGRDPSRYLIDSNLDWGQDMLRLRDVLREEKITKVGLNVMGPADPVRLGFPAHYHVQPWGAAKGWVAVSDHAYRMMRIEGGWRWLAGRPYRRVGKSIRLYYLP